MKSSGLVGGRFLARRISLAAIRGYFWVGMVYEGLLGIYAILKSYEAGQLAKQMGYETLHEDLEKAEFELQKFGNYLDERFAQPAQEEIRSWDLGNTLAAGYQAEGDGGISNWSEEKKEKARAELAARQAAAQAKAEEQARIARVKANGGRVLKFMCIAEDTCTKAPRPECLDYVDDPYCHLSSIRKKDLELFNCNEKGSWDYLSCIIKRSFVEEALASPVPLREALMPPSVLSAMITSAEKMVVDAQNGRQRYNMQQIPVSDYAASTAEVVSDNRFEEKTRHEDQGGKIDSLLKQMKEQQKQMENQSYLNKSIFREMLRYPILEKVMSYLFPNTYASLKGDEYIIRFRHPMHCITEVRGRCVSSSKFFRRRDPKVMWRNPDPLYVDAVKLIGEIGDGLNRAKGIDKKTWGKIELLASKQKSLKKLSRKTEKDLNNYLIKNRKRPIDFRGNEARYGQRMQSTMSAEFKAFGIDDYFNSRGGSKRKYSPQSYQDDDDSSTQTRADGVSFGNVVPGDYEEEEGYTNANANKSGGQKSADGDGGNFAYEENLKIHDLGINKNTQISLFRLISIKYIKHFYLNK
ncbi:MAG: hypothetical protein ISR65_20265 [Bacteriovoracaceae bacterium]|nr:hypothetical protein [Bacteriovoracaceae bacterium]